MQRRKRRDGLGRRQLLTSAAGLMALGMPRLFAQGGRGRGGAAPEAQRGTQLVLLGTQCGPNINARRSQASSAVVVDGGRSTKPEPPFHGHDLRATSAPAEAFKDARVIVRSVENAHFPDRARQQMPYRFLAYRFDTASRSIVISGDTAYSKNLVE